MYNTIMKKILYIFRHGETDSNAQKRMQGWLDVPLNANGVAQAQALAQRLADVKFDVVYSSPLSRAFDTARAVVGDQQIITNDDLRERNMGDFCGHIVRLTDSPADTPIDMSGDVIYAPFALLSNDDYVPPNGESYNVFIARVRKVILDIVKNSDGKTIAIATHTGVAKNIIKQFTDVKWPRGGMPNAEYFKLEYDGEKFTLIDMPDWLSPVLLGVDGKPLTVYHGTYYDFDYFRPLTHFGKLVNAQTNLNEGKWKRDPNIDITKPKIILVNLQAGRWDEIPDLNDHSVQNFMGILFQYMCGDKISDFVRVLNIRDEAEFRKQITAARQAVLDMNIDVPWQFDWVCKPVVGNLSADEVRKELGLETLFDIHSPENLFFQRMILYFESVGLTGFKYPNFTEGPGDMSYINLRQNNIVRLDKELPQHPMPTAEQMSQLRKMRADFATAHTPRKFTTAEKEMLTSELIGFAEFRFNEIKYQMQKSWAKKQRPK